jgi:hypothetical protein
MEDGLLINTGSDKVTIARIYMAYYMTTATKQKLGNTFFEHMTIK